MKDLTKDGRDSIVEEVRKAREELFKQASYDLHTFFENLKKIQEERKARTISRVNDKTACSRMSDVIEFTQCKDK